MSLNIPEEISLADFVFQTLKSCGSSEKVENPAATNPKIVMNSIIPHLSHVM